MAAVRKAEATWEGGLADGKGVVSAATGGIFSDVPVTWASRTEAPDGRTSPEELIAAAHAACYAMAFSHGLGSVGTPPQKLEVSAAVTFDKVGDGWGIVSSALTVRGTVAGIDTASFQKAAEAAKDGCPVSQALKGNVELSVEATLVI